MNIIVNKNENLENISLLQSIKSSPSLIAEAFEYDCDRHFIFESLNKEILSQLGIEKNDVQTNLAKAGDELEYQILEDHQLPNGKSSYGIKGKYYPERGKIKSEDDGLNYEKTIEQLKNPSAEYLYQLTLRPTNKFKKYYKFYDNFDFNDAHPDLVKVETMQDGKKVFRIIDIKLARKVKIKQKIQVTLYALLLQYMLDDPENGITDASVDLEHGYIWYNGNSEPTEFNMREIIPFLEAFLKNKLYNLCENTSNVLINIVKQSQNGINFDCLADHLQHKMSYNCEWCSCYEYCIERQCDKNDIKSMPYISKYAQSFLDDIHGKQANNSSLDISIDAMRDYCQRIKDELEECKSIRGLLSAYDTSSLILEKNLDILERHQQLRENRINKLLKKGNYCKTEIDQWVLQLKSIKEEELNTLNTRLNKLNTFGTNQYLSDYLNKKIDMITEIISISEEILNNNNEETVIKKMEELKEHNLAIQTFYCIDKANMQIPKMENIRIFLTAQADEATGRMFALGLRYESFKVEIIPGVSKSANYSYVAQDKNDFDNQEELFVENLYGIFLKINQYNSTLEWADQLSVQTYVMDNYEWNNIKQVLFKMLSENRKPKEVLTILFCLQSAELVTQDETPKSIVCQFPVVALTPVVRQLFILPADISYGMDDLSKIFEVDKPYKKIVPQYANKLTNVLPSELINSSWKAKDNNDMQCANELYDKVKREIEARLFHTSNILNGMRKEIQIEEKITGKSILISWAKKFIIPGTNNYSLPVLSQLDFQTRYEAMLEKLKVRAPRLDVLEDSVKENKIIRVKYLDPNNNQEIFQILNPNPMPIVELPFATMICPATDAGINELHSYEDNSNFINTKKYELLESINYDEYRIITNSNRYYIQFKLNNKSKGEVWPLVRSVELHANSEYFLVQYYTDWLSHYIVGGSPSTKQPAIFGILSDIDKNIFNVDMRLFLSDPLKFVTKLVNQSMNFQELSGYENKFPNTFTGSQRDAFYQFYKQNLSLVIGPPGTGKTNFIAMSILILMMKYHDKPMRVLVTGMSHPSIENVLNKIVELNQKIQGGKINLSIGKVDGMRIKNRFIADVDKKNVKAFFDNKTTDKFILGSTVWGVGKAYAYDDLDNSKDLFDVIVIDEASQLKLMDSLLVLCHASKMGRLLIVGDDEQLPPIIQGVYDEIDNQEINTHDSIFRFLHDVDKLGLKNTGMLNYTKKLTEQFRMNDILALYPAQQIYGQAYKAGSTTISQQKLDILSQSTSSMYDFIMDPEYPFVICDITGGSNKDKRDVEVEIVGALAQWCSNFLCDKNKQAYNDTEMFWKEGMFIISPHHEQINLIKEKLKSLIGINKSPLSEHAFVDTVDKMQGQEADVAIISYGVTDLEQAMMEKEFIFSRNRLNVSITRAKKKMILILSDVLVNKQIDILDETDEDIIRGIEFMTSIKKFVQQSGNENGFNTKCKNDSWNIGNGVTVHIYKKGLA